MTNKLSKISLTSISSTGCPPVHVTLHKTCLMKLKNVLLLKEEPKRISRLETEELGEKFMTSGKAKLSKLHKSFRNVR